MSLTDVVKRELLLPSILNPTRVGEDADGVGREGGRE